MEPFAPNRDFCPPVAAWFAAAFPCATDTQLAAWEQIRRGHDTLIAAPTGSGKTLAALLCSLDDLVRASLRGGLPDQLYVLYLSPLKALSNDVRCNLDGPLAGIEAVLNQAGRPAAGIRTAVRTGDTAAADRAAMVRRPPHVLVTTPESLYLLLSSESGRKMLAPVQTVIVDELHALAGSKRGAHLSLSLARLDRLAHRPRRIGLSATQRPLPLMACFLTGAAPAAIVDAGHQRRRDLALALPDTPLAPVMSHAVWDEIYTHLTRQISAHETTLIFVNTRRLAERVAHALTERLEPAAVMAHHGSLSRSSRQRAEQALKAGEVRVLVATASLELGIDVGAVDLVCQLGSPGSINAFLQRVGRSGHAVKGLPKGRLYPLSRDDLVECMALLQAEQAGALDWLEVPSGALDVLAQQLVAEVASRPQTAEELLSLVRRAWPYRELSREDFQAVLQMLTEGYASRRGRRSAWLRAAGLDGQIHAHAGTRQMALQNGGAIPDQFDYDVILMPEEEKIGTLGEHFAFDSVAGDVFQLGNRNYQFLRREQSRVLVQDAGDQPPNVPFWFGERPGRSDVLSEAVSRLRQQLARDFSQAGAARARERLIAQGFESAAAAQLVAYLHPAWEAFGCLPDHRRVVLERFFDETGNMHLVLHAPLGARVMRAWGLALRKRFCCQFNFELQAAALEDCLILSLSETHSFELAEVMRYLHPHSVESVLIQALLDAPLFEARWRWNATTALAIERMRNGRRVPAQWQRNQAEDLVSVVFPDQLACAENLSGPRAVPDHPLVQQTLRDCLQEAMDLAGLQQVLEQLRAGTIRATCADLLGPSPLAAEIISARPYAFLDDGEAEERRTRAIARPAPPASPGSALRRIRQEACARVSKEVWIHPASPDELYQALLEVGGLSQSEYSTGESLSGAAALPQRWSLWFQALQAEQRAFLLRLPEGACFWVADARLPEWQALHPGAIIRPAPAAGLIHPEQPQRGPALMALMRDRLAALGPVSRARLGVGLGVGLPVVEEGLEQLRAEGSVVRLEQEGVGHLWCERRLLARVHHYSRSSVGPA